jgi:hypothetical protein
MGWRWPLELAADSREAASRQAFVGSRLAMSVSSLPWGRGERYAFRRRVAAVGATRFGDGGPHDRSPPKNPGTRGFRVNISVPDIFCGEATRSASSTKPSPSRAPVIERRPKAGCLGLSQRHFSYKDAPMTA